MKSHINKCFFVVAQLKLTNKRGLSIALIGPFKCKLNAFTLDYRNRFHTHTHTHTRHCAGAICYEMFEAIFLRMNSRRRPLLLYIFKFYAPIYVLFWFIRFANGSIVLLKHLHTHFVQPQRVNIVFLKIFRIIIYSLCILGEEESITKCNGC